MASKDAKKKIKKRACMVCKKMIPEDKGVVTLRGMSFSCKECYKKEKRKSKGSETCEFC